METTPIRSPRTSSGVQAPSPAPGTTKGSLYLDLLGSTTRLVSGKQYVTRVIEAGTGEPLILVHGVGNSAECFARNVIRLSTHFHVYAIDALYHGFSTKEPYDADHRVQRQAEAVVDFMDAEGIDRASIEGESMGAGIAFELGMRHPERCRKLVLNSGNYYIRYSRSFGPPPPVILSGAKNPEGGPGGAAALMTVSRAAAENPTRETIRRRLEYFVADPPRINDEIVDLQYLLYSDPEVLASMKRVYGMTAPRGSLAGWSEEDAKTMRVPTLVIWTDRNTGAPPEAGEYLAGLLPNGRCQIIHDACHWPQWEHPEQHDEIVTHFLQSPLPLGEG